MPLTSKGREIFENMRKTYGSDKKAKEVFYASRNSGKITGVDPESSRSDSVDPSKVDQILSECNRHSKMDEILSECKAHR